MVPKSVCHHYRALSTAAYHHVGDVIADLHVLFWGVPMTFLAAWKARATDPGCIDDECDCTVPEPPRNRLAPERWTWDNE